MLVAKQQAPAARHRSQLTKVGVAVESALATTKQDRLKVLAEVNARSFGGNPSWMSLTSDGVKIVGTGEKSR